ncbi:AraC family transcriptional regulator [Bradyrhizobium sp. CB1015]|uniref:helix-turn-helix transcriptional regulator n=1 Tax=Bradyrhizobium sp. CB1015 TaxID=2976822 RepID=UPI0021AAD0B1|nr:AraC family transcriptional regulator [Bradyrhizobium sp. CB1015]UWU91021.1 AraC family transcriptional regulator [Bradyrhizobium sp. CB1015]
MARILDAPPRLVPEVLHGDARLTRKWAHGGLQDDYMRGVAGHVAVGCYEGQHQISWRIENRLLNSRTNPKTFTLIPQGVDGTWNIAGPVVVSHVYLTQERLQACADEIAGGRRVELLPRVSFTDPAAAGLLDILSQEAERDSASSRLFVEQAIDLLCSRLIQEHSSFRSSPVQVRKGGLADWQVRRVTTFMDENLRRQVGLDELAALVGLSRFHFCTAFRQSTGQTPHAWLTEQRMKCARELLAHSRFSVTEVALAVGYETPSAFAATFRRRVGVTPLAFRRAL